jgi:5-methylcytosine-specific restriction endonuclease McrA
LAYNRATPDIPPALRRAVRIRDRCCTFPGCDRPWNWADLHHIVPRNRGGPTTAENLTLLCRFHHTTVHEGGWQLTRGPNGKIEVTSP